MAAPTLDKVRIYHDLLVASASGEFATKKKVDADTILNLHLLKEEALIDAGLTMENFVLFANLTPKGALSLVQWHDLLASRSWRSTVLSTAEKFMWLFMGVLLTTGGKLLERWLGLAP